MLSCCFNHPLTGSISSEFVSSKSKQNIVAMKYLLGICLTLFGMIQSIACECDSIPSVEKAYQSADQILVARVVKIEMIYTGEATAVRSLTVSQSEESGKIETVMRNSYKRVTLEVKDVLKGKVIGDQQVIYTGIDETECGFDFGVDRKYVIYNYFSPEDERIIGRTRLDEKLLFTDHCTRTMRYKKGEVKELENLGD